MYNDKKRYYTPQFSEIACITVRRIAWALNVSMPKAINIIIRELSSAFRHLLFVRSVRAKQTVMCAGLISSQPHN